MVAACSMALGCGGDDDGGEAPAAGNGLGSGPYYIPKRARRWRNSRPWSRPDPPWPSSTIVHSDLSCVTDLPHLLRRRLPLGQLRRRLQSYSSAPPRAASATSRTASRTSGLHAVRPVLPRHPCGKHPRIPLCGYRGALKDAASRTSTPRTSSPAEPRSQTGGPQALSPTASTRSTRRRKAEPHCDTALCPDDYAARARSAPACQ